jgi:hypothetical protein
VAFREQHHSLNISCIITRLHLDLIQILAPEDSFEIESIRGSPSEVILTPITSGLIRMEVQDFMDDFMLEA